MPERGIVGVIRKAEFVVEPAACSQRLSVKVARLGTFVSVGIRGRSRTQAFPRRLVPKVPAMPMN
jgi:hypothetical protein